MSVGEELVECPLCMEPLELDDINFFPCTCGYQICRFCWHRIRTDENGLCPACRKQYPEDPAQFKPLTDDELQRIKKERRQKDVQRKQKAAENRKHLANVRVVQRNLVFVVGLSQRLADTDTLRKHDYFGKFGKIHKVVINQNTSYAGAQGPSASAYVTYVKPEDALKAIQAVNNCHVDGRTLKASLGTTKYCSHFLRGSQCPKPDCMYLHELGEEAASFTKEEMQQGKHQEYEQKLYEQFMNSQNLQNHTTTTTTSTTATTTSTTTTTKSHSKRKTGSPPLQSQSQGQTSTSGGGGSHSPGSSGSGKEGWPTLSGGGGSGGGGKTDRVANGSAGKTHTLQTANSQKPETQNAQNRAPGQQRSSHSTESHNHIHSSKSKDRGQTGASSPVVPAQTTSSGGSSPPHNNGVGSLKSTQLPSQNPPVGTQLSQSKPAMPGSTSPTHATAAPSTATPPPLVPAPPLNGSIGATTKLPRKSPFDTSNSMSLFSSSGFPANRKSLQPPQITAENVSHTPEIPDTLPVSTCTDWQAAFGFSSSLTTELHDDDLGFDPWNESSKALADMIEKESLHMAQQPQTQNRQTQAGLNHFTENNASQSMRSLPPGFTPNHVGAFPGNPMGVQGSKMLGLMQIPTVTPSYPTPAYHDVLSGASLTGKSPAMPNTQSDPTQLKDWQEGLRALLPNINISFGAAQQQQQQQQQQHLQQQQHIQQQQQQMPLPSQHNHIQSQTQKGWGSPSCPPDLGWDPAIVTSGNISDATANSIEEPHWMASLKHLTDETSNQHRMPFMPPQLSSAGVRAPVWPQHTPAAHPPPGFAPPQVRPHTQVAESRKLTEGLQ